MSSPRDSWRERRIPMEQDRDRVSIAGPRRHNFLTDIEPLTSAVIQASGLKNRGIRNALDVQLRHQDLTVPRLPEALEGFTILHLSDLHFGTLPGLEEKALSLLAGVEVDLVALTGDVQTYGKPTPPEITPWLGALKAGIQSRFGWFAVLGNHDGHDMVPALEQLGMTVLVNEQTTLRDGDHSIALTGVDDVNRFYTPEAETALRALPEGDLRIALVHTPDMATMAAEIGAEVYLCGHTHGGQICLPGGKPVFVSLDTHKELAVGPWTKGSMAGHTSSGLGVGVPPVRFNCRGEAVVIRLTRRPPPGADA
ncbi:MAG: metallophosphoesterase [Rhodospirillaceae bacterium]